MEIVGFVVKATGAGGVFALVVLGLGLGLDDGGLAGLVRGKEGGRRRMGRPAREAWIVEVGAWRWVPGPGV